MATARTADSGFDAAVVDSENQVVALVEVKVQPVERWATILSRQLAKVADRVAFVIAIDPKSIQLYKPGEESLGDPIVQLDTSQVLQYYDPGFPGKRVFEFYVLTLVEAWLRDLAYHWKSEKPPGSEELAKAGLLEKLEGGTTLRFGA